MDTTQHTTTTTQWSLSSEVSELLKIYLSSKEKSIRQIEYYTDVSRSYVKRLSDNEISDDKINPFKLFSILKFIKGPDFATDFISRKKQWSEKLQSVTGMNPEISKKSIENRDIENIVLTSDSTIIAFILACNNNGTSLKELKDVGGNLAVKAAYLLEENKIVKIEAQKVTSLINQGDSSFFTFSRNGTKKLIQTFSELYDIEHAGQNRNYIFTATESVSKEFLHKFYNKAAEFRNWCTIETKKDENIGDNPFFFSMLMDTFTDELKPTEVVQ